MGDFLSCYIVLLLIPQNCITAYKSAIHCVCSQWNGNTPCQRVQLFVSAWTHLMVLQATTHGETPPTAPGSCSRCARCCSVTRESWSWCRSWPESTARWRYTLSLPPTYLGFLTRSRSPVSSQCWPKTSTFLSKLQQTFFFFFLATRNYLWGNWVRSECTGITHFKSVIPSEVLILALFGQMPKSSAALYSSCETRW